MRVDPKTLIRRLTPTCTRGLESAVGRAASGRYYEIVVEHLLREFLESEDGDVARILHHYGQDRTRLLARVSRTLETMRTGNAARPVFSETLFQWFEDTWVVASLEVGATKLRSGDLFRQFITQPGRYTADNYAEIEGISPETLKRELVDIIAPSKETAEVAPEPGSGPSQQGGPNPGRPTGDEALKRFTTSYTDRARKGEIDPIFGREREVRQLIDILARRRKNNPIIVGEAGVGKTALVEGLAHSIVSGDVPEFLRNTDILGLDLGLLQAGAGVKGEFENRLKQVIAEVKSSTKPIVLFIDEAHTMIGAGGAQGGSDASNLLKPALARGELRTIAATTWGEYKKYFEKDPALERRFQPVKVEEPSEENAVVMLRGLKDAYEKSHGVPIRDEAIVAAVKLSHRYISGRQLPDKAVDLLDTAAARVRIELDSKPEVLVDLESAIAGYDRAIGAIERDLAAGAKSNLEDFEELKKKQGATKDKHAVAKAQWEAERSAVVELKKTRDALTAAPKDADQAPFKSAIADATSALEKVRGEDILVHSEADGDVVARVVASWTGIPVTKMKTDTISAILGLEDKLRDRVRGQEAAIKAVSEVIRTSTAGIANPTQPIGVLLFVGPSGVGKTETALTLADTLYGGERFLTSINMSEFQEKHTVSKLVGSPPGYVGYGEGGVLTEAVRQRPYSVVLLDECEKADLEVMNLFYQVFDKGMLSDGEGRVINFRNTVVILTSNLATDAIMKLYEGDETPTTDEVVDKIRPILSKHFKPALLARMTIVPYRPINREIMKEITKMRLDGLAKRLQTAHRIETKFDDVMVDEITARCTASETGARNVEHILRGSLVPAVSRMLLERMAQGTVGRKLEIGLAPDGGWRMDLSET